MTERAIAYLGGHDAVEYVQNVTGSSPRVGTNQGRATLTVILKPWKERDKKVEEVMRDVQREFHDYPEISAFTTRPPWCGPRFGWWRRVPVAGPFWSRVG